VILLKVTYPLIWRSVSIQNSVFPRSMGQVLHSPQKFKIPSSPYSKGPLKKIFTWTENQRTWRKIHGDFLSYSLPHFYEHEPSRRRKRSLPDDSEKVHYGLTFDGRDHHLELWPNHAFISPGMMIEERGVGASLGFNNVKIRRTNTTRILSLYLESRAAPGISASHQ
jgi:hypothetical protein